MMSEGHTPPWEHFSIFGPLSRVVTVSPLRLQNRYTSRGSKIWRKSAAGPNYDAIRAEKTPLGCME